MKKIIHLSDLHIGHENCREKFNSIVQGIITRMKPAHNYIILVTGDIVDNANHREHSLEAVSFFRDLEKQGFTVLAIPGNHDYGSGVLGDVKFVEYFKETFFRSKRISYPKLDIIDGIAFFGLDSTAEELHFLDRFLSDGELGKRQLNRLRRMLAQPDVASLKKVVYLHHHPFDFKLGMQLKDSAGLKKIIENRIDLLLFGHYHVDPESAGKVYNGMWGIKRCYNAGSSTHKNDNSGFQRVIDLSSDDTSADYDGKFIENDPDIINRESTW